MRYIFLLAVVVLLFFVSCKDNIENEYFVNFGNMFLFNGFNVKQLKGTMIGFEYYFRCINYINNNYYISFKVIDELSQMRIMTYPLATKDVSPGTTLSIMLKEGFIPGEYNISFSIFTTNANTTNFVYIIDYKTGNMTPIKNFSIGWYSALQRNKKINFYGGFTISSYRFEYSRGFLFINMYMYLRNRTKNDYRFELKAVNHSGKVVAYKLSGFSVPTSSMRVGIMYRETIRLHLPRYRFYNVYFALLNQQGSVRVEDTKLKVVDNRVLLGNIKLKTDKVIINNP